MAKRASLSARKGAVQAATAASEAESTGGGKKVGLAVRLDLDRHEQLQDLANSLTRQSRREGGGRVSIHSLLLEGVDLVMAKYGGG